MAVVQRWHGVNHNVSTSTPRRFGVSRRVIYFTVFLWRLLGAVKAFARRCHGIYCARVELSLTASNGVFLMKIDKKRYANFKNDKSKHYFKCTYMYKESFTMSIEQHAGLSRVHLEAQLIKIAVDAASILL